MATPLESISLCGSRKWLHLTKFHYHETTTFRPVETILWIMFFDFSQVNIQQCAGKDDLVFINCSFGHRCSTPLGHMMRFTTACTETLTPRAWNTHRRNYNRLKTGHVLTRRPLSTLLILERSHFRSSGDSAVWTFLIPVQTSELSWQSVCKGESHEILNSFFIIHLMISTAGHRHRGN